MPNPVKVPVSIEETETSRFESGFIARFSLLAVTVVVVLFMILAEQTNVFDSTITYTGADGKQVVESTFNLASAKFAIAALLTFGGLTVLAGVVVELADMKLTTRKAESVAEVAPDNVTLESITATGVAAVGVAIGQIFTALGSALKGLRASAALLLTGTGMMVTGGLVAWNTIPDTDYAPTIEITTETTEIESTEPTEAETTERTVPETTEPDTSQPTSPSSINEP